MSVAVKFDSKLPDGSNTRDTIIDIYSIELVKSATASGLDGVLITAPYGEERTLIIQLTAREFLNAAKLIKGRANIGYDIDNPMSGKNPNGPHQPQ
jgi:hypothetical protein